MVGQEIMALAGHREDMPLELNQEVLVNLRYFLNDARGFMIRSLSRGQKYIPMMKAILRQKGLPEDLVYMALIESGFRTEAVSHASAVGPWQFIASTGRNYGLVINEYMDERMDPVKSTYAAADYLIALHDMFNSWPLAIAAYNTGEAKIMRGMKDPNTDNYWDMAKRDGFLANETKRYVPSFLAAAIISKDPQAYGLEIESSPPDAWEDVIVPQPLALSVAAELSGSSLDRIKELNPHLKRNATPPNETNFVLRVPEGSRATFYRMYAQLPESKRGGGLITYTARRGETVEQVASRHGLTPSVVSQYNDVSEKTRLASGQTLVLPSTMPPETTDTVVAAAQRQRPRPAPAYSPPVVIVSDEPPTPPAPPVAVAQAPSGRPGSTQPQRPTVVASNQVRRPQVIDSISHRVRSGDTILGIAKLYGVKAEQIKSDNKLASNNIREGQILNIRSNLPLTASNGSRSSRNTWVQVSEGVPASHTVTSGETISTIAANYKVSQRQLMDLNGLTSANIRVGQKLKIGTVPAPPSKVTGGADYKVVAGDTVSTIADRYGLTSEELRQINNLASNNLRIGQVLKVPAIKTTATASAAKTDSTPSEYQVREGDTISGIAQRMGVKEENIRKLNDISDDLINAGQTLKVAAGGTVEREYVVVAGDTVSTIADRNKMTSADLRRLNNLTGDNLRIGQKLKVLEGGGSSQRTQVASAASRGSDAGTGETQSAQRSPEPGSEVYVVQSGDTVSQIAERFNMRSADLRALNNLPNDGIRPGQRLAVSASAARASDSSSSSQAAAQRSSAQASAGSINASDTYVVQSGDTVSQIAERFGMSSADLRQVNNLNDDAIRIGQRLFVSGGSPSGTRPSAQAASSQGAGSQAASSQASSGSARSSGDTYVVQIGDTVSQIAERFGMRSADLRQLNNLSDDAIRIGQKLIVSGGSPSGTRPSAQAGSSQAGSSQAAGSQAAGSQAASSQATSGSARSSGDTYVVQNGDTVSQIAERFGMRSADLRSLNNLSGDNIRVGQKLAVKGARVTQAASTSGSSGSGTYKVVPGDTMYSIANKHKLTVDKLKSLNDKQNDIVRPGEILKVM
jgi:membrane-bound lytic murein transglycosylase D